MTISYPLNLPTSVTAREVVIRRCATVALSASPFTGEQQVYVHQGEWFEIDFALPPMPRATAAAWIGFLLALNGREGTFLAGIPSEGTARGTATGTPLVNGAGQSGKTLNTRGWTAGITGILTAGDWLQLGSGSGTHLHAVVQDANSQSGSPDAGLATLDIWPRLRSAPSDGDAITISNAKGLWRLAGNSAEWSIGEAAMYGLNFSAVEAI